MTLPASHPITAQQINVELGRAAGAVFDMDGSQERALAGIPSGGYSFSDFLGKTAIAPAGDFDFLGSYIGSGTSVALGAADAARRIFITAHWLSAGASPSVISSASIGGVPTTIHVQDGHSGGSTGLGVAILSAVVPTGTTGSVVLNGVASPRFGVFRAVGLPASPTDTDSANGVNTTSASVSVSVPANGILLAAGTGSSETSTCTVTSPGDLAYSTFFPNGKCEYGSALSSQTAVCGVAVTPSSNVGCVIAALSWVGA